MEKWRVERVKAVLKDFHYMEQYIKKLEREILVPYQEAGRRNSNEEIRLDVLTTNFWTIHTHMLIRDLKRSSFAVKKLLEECDNDTETIINELYIKKFTQYTMQGLVNQRIILVSLSTAKRLRDRFFEELDKQLDF